MARKPSFKFKFKPAISAFYEQPFTFSQKSFVGGINSSVLPNSVSPEKEMVDCSNMIVALDMFLKTRYGFSKLDDSIVGKAVRGMTYFGDALAVAADSTLYVNGVSVGTLDSSSGPVNFLNFHGELLIMDGGQLKRYNGTDGLRTVTNAPKASFGVIHKERIWVAGSPDEPYTVFVCGPNDIEDWGSAGLSLGTFFQFDPYDTSSTTAPNEITGLTVYMDAVIVFKRGAYPRVFRIDGNDTASFVASEVGEGVTCINPQTVASTPIGIFFLSHDGVYLLSASSQDSIMLASSLINAKFLSSFTLSNLWAVYYNKYGVYIIGNGTTLYVLNIYTKGWFKWDLQSNIECITVSNEKLLLGTDVGTILEYLENTYDDWSTSLEKDVEIESELTTCAYEFNSSSLTKLITTCYLALEAIQEGTITVTFTVNQASLYGVQVQTLYKQTGVDLAGVATFEAVRTGIGSGGLAPKTMKYILETESDVGWDDSNFAWDGGTTIGFDGRINMPYVHKMNIGARGITLTAHIKASGTPITLQSIGFLGAVLQPAP